MAVTVVYEVTETRQVGWTCCYLGAAGKRGKHGIGMRAYYTFERLGKFGGSSGDF